MPDRNYSETHFVLRAALVCGLIGGAWGTLLAHSPIAQYFRLVMIGAALMGVISAKAAAAAATFTGWMLLVPIAVVPLVALAVLAAASGGPPAVSGPLAFVIAMPLFVFAVAACVTIKVDS